MVKLCGKRVYLATLEKEDCRKIWEDFEYDFEAKTEPLSIGHSFIKADKWFEEIQEKQGEKNIRLGIFLNEGTVIGDIALQDIDWKNRSCSLGMGLSKKEYRGKGYGSEAVGLILEHGFNNVGLERIWASTLEHNSGAIKSLENNGLINEGIERKAIYFGGKRWDRYVYSILSEEYNK